MPNRRLAEGMITAGIPFATPDEGGPCLNYYTQGLLKDRGWAKGPLPNKAFEERVLAVAQSGATNAAGHVVFFFERTAEAQSFVKAWDATAELVKQHHEWETMPPEERAKQDKAPDPIPNISAEVIAQVLCLHANNMKLLPQIIFSRAPICNLIEGEFKGAERPPGASKECATGVPIGTTEGSGPAWSTDLDDATRAKMELHPRIKVWVNPHSK